MQETNSDRGMRKSRKPRAADDDINSEDERNEVHVFTIYTI